MKRRRHWLPSSTPCWRECLSANSANSKATTCSDLTYKSTVSSVHPTQLLSSHPKKWTRSYSSPWKLSWGMLVSMSLLSTQESIWSCALTQSCMSNSMQIWRHLMKWNVLIKKRLRSCKHSWTLANLSLMIKRWPLSKSQGPQAPKWMMSVTR